MSATASSGARGPRRRPGTPHLACRREHDQHGVSVAPAPVDEQRHEAGSGAIGVLERSSVGTGRHLEQATHDPAHRRSAAPSSARMLRSATSRSASGWPSQRSASVGSRRRRRRGLDAGERLDEAGQRPTRAAVVGAARDRERRASPIDAASSAPDGSARARVAGRRARRRRALRARERRSRRSASSASRPTNGPSHDGGRSVPAGAAATTGPASATTGSAPPARDAGSATIGSSTTGSATPGSATTLGNHRPAVGAGRAPREVSGAGQQQVRSSPTCSVWVTAPPCVS